MARYALKRLLLVVPTLLLVSLFVFAIVRAIPGDVVDMMLEQLQYGRDAADLRAKLGLDRPVVEQYLTWVGQVLRGDLGQSLWTNRPAAADIAARFPVTITLSLLSIAVSNALAIIMRPDQQDYQGTGVTVEVARKLDVPRMVLVVNKVPPLFNMQEVKARVERTYNVEVAAVIPHSDEMMTLASEGVFVLRFPNHPITQTLKELADALMR